MEQFHRESDTFAQSSCHRPPQRFCLCYPQWETRLLILQAQVGFMTQRLPPGILMILSPGSCSQLSASRTTLTQTDLWLRVLPGFWGHQLWTGLKRESEELSSCSSPHGVLSWGCRPRERSTLYWRWREARLLWLQDHQLVPWTDYKQHTHLCTYSSSRCLALSRWAIIT